MYGSSQRKQDFMFRVASYSTHPKRTGYSVPDLVPRVNEISDIPMLEHERARILRLKEELDVAVKKIKNELEEAMARKRWFGEHADSAWWKKANYALVVKGRQSQKCQQLVRELNQRIKSLKQDSYGHLFIEAAKQILSKSQFDEIWNAVRRIRGE